MIDLVSAAIRGRIVLSLHYDPGMRQIEPHCFGYGTDGQLLLRAFQISGASNSNEHRDWKLFRLDRCMHLAHTSDIFIGPRPDYNPRDRVMTRGIIAAL